MGVHSRQSLLTFERALTHIHLSNSPNIHLLWFTRHQFVTLKQQYPLKRHAIALARLHSSFDDQFQYSFILNVLEYDLYYRNLCCATQARHWSHSAHWWWGQLLIHLHAWNQSLPFWSADFWVSGPLTLCPRRSGWVSSSSWSPTTETQASTQVSNRSDPSQMPLYFAVAVRVMSSSAWLHQVCQLWQWAWTGASSVGLSDFHTFLPVLQTPTASTQSF